MRVFLRGSTLLRKLDLVAYADGIFRFREHGDSIVFEVAQEAISYLEEEDWDAGKGKQSKASKLSKKKIGEIFGIDWKEEGE